MNPVVHLELRTRDLAGSSRFLTELLGWRAEHVRLGDRSCVALGWAAAGSTAASPSTIEHLT